MAALRQVFVALLLLACAALPAAAREVITSFTSDVTVQTSGELEVREKIVVIAEGDEIKRGIFRDFPTTYNKPDGTRVRVGFEVLGVTRNGREENYVVESISNGQRIRIGNRDVFLEHGEHTYVITYRTNRQIGFFETYDELYWNVTGNGWTFPIEEAVVIIRLPEGASISQHALYTGAFGSTAAEAQVVENNGNRFKARTTSGLLPGEGFTVAVGWQKGIITPPSSADRHRDWIRDNASIFVLLLTAFGVAAYYLYAWNRVGRDPPAGTIVPLFHPPEGMGPACVRYAWKHGFDDKAFAAGLVGLAVKGHASISDLDGDYTVSKQASPKANTHLTRSEQALLRAMPQTLELEQSNHSEVRTVRSALANALNDEYDGVMFLKNFKWFLWGFLLSLAGLVLAALLMPGEEGSVMLFSGVFTAGWWGTILAVGWGAVKGLFNGNWLTRIRSLMGMVFLVPFVLAGIAVPTFVALAEGISPLMKWFSATAVLLVALNLLFYWLLKAPTPKGRKVLDHLEGLRLYMTTAEEERLKVLHPPEKTPQLFERYLPFAMALDCENEWNDKFSAVLAAAAAAGATTGAVGSWYTGNSSFGSRDFTDSLGSSLTSAISSSSTAPGSSSGSGGGGSSGGGGGGGGGGGW